MHETKSDRQNATRIKGVTVHSRRPSFLSALMYILVLFLVLRYNIHKVCVSVFDVFICTRYALISKRCLEWMKKREKHDGPIKENGTGETRTR